MDSINVYIQIAERILGWTRMSCPDVRFMKPGVSYGTAELCPNFVESSKAQILLREEMSKRGYSLKITYNPLNSDRNEEKSCTAIFTLGEKSFESTQPEENAAVCIAALLTIGVSPDSEVE